MNAASDLDPVELSTTVPVIASVLQPFVDSGTMAGAVTLAATADRILSLDAVGYADLAARTPMTIDTLFWIASMTKPMTGTAFMMLVDEGKVNVDDPVEKYLPEFTGQMVVAEKDEDHVLLKKPWHPILVREILCHTAGLSHTSPIEKPTLDQFDLRDAARSYAMTPLQFEPGTKYQYANAGTNTAGRIIEVVSGMSYEAFMQERLLTPLGMKDTTFRPNDEQLRRLAKTYRSNADKTGLEEAAIAQLSYPLNNPARKSMPAGGLFSTAIDCLAFCRMILNGGEYQGRRYLSVAAVRQMTSKQTGDGVDQAHGFCWKTEIGNYGHGGAYKTDMTIRPKLGLITAYLVQQAGDWPNADGDRIFPLFNATAKQLALAARTF